MSEQDDVILLSSDDDFESPPPKKMKPNIANRKTIDVMKKLNKLKEISAAPCEDTKSVLKNAHTEINSITIIIEGNEQSKENEHVNLVEENATEQRDNSDDCMVVCLESENEDTPEEHQESPTSKEPDNGPVDPLITEQNEVVTNGNAASPETEAIILSRPSTSTASEAHTLLDELLETCAASMKGSKYESRVLPKFQKMRKNFNECENIHEDHNFKSMLREHIVSAKISAPEAVVSFQRIYSYLLDHIHGASVEVTEEDAKKIKKLEKTCKLLMRKLKRLEEAEVNFNEEEDSTYMQMDRYSQRLNKVYNKYCQLLKRNPHAGRFSHERVQFVQSNYNEINRALTKGCKNNKFPTYYEVEKWIRKCITKHNLGLSETEIRDESTFCFKKLGHLLQVRRMKDLYEVHGSYIALTEDPATKDQELKKKLQESEIEGEKKLKEVVEKYVKLQENNVTVDVSEDSDDSNYKTSDSGDS